MNIENIQSSDETDQQNDFLDQIEADLKQMPPALEPIYTIDDISQPILLYDGSLEIQQDGRIIEGSGVVEFDWFPYSGIKYKFQSNTSGFIDSSTDAHLRLTTHETSAKISLSSTKVGEIITASGNISEAISIGSDRDLEYLLCHIVNFHDLLGRPVAVLSDSDGGYRCIERNVLEAEGWKLTLDQLRTTTEHVEQLNRQGGFAITHVAKLERVDDQTFNGEEAINFLNLCSHFFSFARGFRIPIILLVGYNSLDKEVWRYWDSRAGLPWKGVSSWFPKHENGVLSQLLPGFLNWWRSWGEDIANTALHWYLESNINAGALEGSIVLTQVALELIAWTIFVKQENITIDGFEKLPASDKLRLLLHQFKISAKLPPDWEAQPMPALFKDLVPEPPQLLQNLVGMAGKNGNKWVDGPHAFTEFRNGIVHPKKLKRVLNADAGATFEACSLGRWYLELVLLALCGYQWKYINRLLIPHQAPEFVPWVQSSQSSEQHDM
jgi:hypothetical protein